MAIEMYREKGIIRWFIPGTSLGVCLILRVHGSGRWSLGLSHNWGF